MTGLKTHKNFLMQRLQFSNIRNEVEVHTIPGHFSLVTNLKYAVKINVTLTTQL